MRGTRMKVPAASLMPPEPSRSRAQVIDIRPYLACLPAPEDESAAGARWSDLLHLVLDAWTWRDPESIAALGSLVSILKAQVLADWRE